MIFQTYTIQGTPKDGGILPRSLDVLFNSIQGKQYDRMNLKPRFCSDVARLGVEAEQKEQVLKNVLLSSLNKEVLQKLMKYTRIATHSKIYISKHMKFLVLNTVLVTSCNALYIQTCLHLLLKPIQLQFHSTT